MLVIDANKVQHRMIDLDIPSAASLARRAGLHFNTLHAVLNGGQFSSVTLWRLAQALKMPACDLLLEIPDSKNSLMENKDAGRG